MPTGYGYDAIENNMNLKEFTLRCARAFGYAMSQRDEPGSTPIRKQEDTRQIDLTEAKTTLKEAQDKWQTMLDKTDEDKKNDHTAYITRQTKEYKETIERYKKGNRYWDNLKVQVDAWIPPSKDHIGIKDFMLQQIKVNREDVEYVENNLIELTKGNWEEHYQILLGCNERSVTRAQEDVNEFHKIIKENKPDWLDLLKSSL